MDAAKSVIGVLAAASEDIDYYRAQLREQRAENARLQRHSTALRTIGALCAAWLTNGLFDRHTFARTAAEHLHSIAQEAISS